MPIRLVVTDAQFEQAARILADASRPVAEGGDITTEPWGHETSDEVDQETIGEDQERVVEEALASNKPWEILAIAYLFFVPGLGFLLENRSLILITRRAYRGPGTFIVLSPLGLHFVGVLLIAASLLLTFCYFYTRRVIAGDEQAARVAQSSES